MSLKYKFKKEFLENGYAYRPRVNVEIEGIPFIPLLDSGCDTTVVSESFADAFGIKKGEKVVMAAFREKHEVYRGKINIKFLGRNQREDELLIGVPCLIIPKTGEHEEDADVILGGRGFLSDLELYLICQTKGSRLIEEKNKSERQDSNLRI